MTNKRTIISQIPILLRVSTLLCHPHKPMWNILIVNFITDSCISNNCVTWQGIDYKLPEDDSKMSKHVGV